MFCTKQKVQQATRHTGQSNATLREILNRIVAKVKKTWNAIEDNLRTTITSWRLSSINFKVHNTSFSRICNHQKRTF